MVRGSPLATVLASGHARLWPDVPRAVADELVGPSSVLGTPFPSPFRSALVVPFGQGSSRPGLLGLLVEETSRELRHADLDLADKLAQLAARVVEPAPEFGSWSVASAGAQAVVRSTDDGIPTPVLARSTHHVDETLPTRPDARADDLRRLTRREVQVLRLIERGLSNREIAGNLGITPGTVKVNVERILCKLGAVNRTQAARRARELDPPRSRPA